ncbi:MAG TPA: Rpn family recombination-promoting nuclease/putative transposase [Nannocystis sp.]
MHQTPHDALFKAAFSNLDLARDALTHILGPLAAELDLANLTLVSGSFVDEALRNRHADLVFSTTLAGQPVLVYILYEHQSTDEPWMPLRVMIYMSRLWDAVRKEQPELTQLPPIVPVVLHHGERPWRSPRHFEALVAAPPALLPHVPHFSFVLYDLARDETTVQTAPAGVRLVLLALQRARLLADLAQLFRGLAPTLRELAARPGAQEVVRLVFRYIGMVRGVGDRAIIDVIATEVGPEEARQMQTLAEMWEHQGREKGRQEGRLEGRLETERKNLKRLLRWRFGEVPASVLARIEQADVSALEHWNEAVLSAHSLEELFPSS